MIYTALNPPDCGMRAIDPTNRAIRLAHAQSGVLFVIRDMKCGIKLKATYAE